MKTVQLQFQADFSGNESNYFMREAFNTLRTNVLFCGTDIKVILVTSCIAHEGKTTVSVELAKNLAEAGKRVLLIDADLRKSVMVSRYTDEKGVKGLSELLSGQAALGDAVYRSQISGLDLIFAGPFPPNPTEMLGSDSLKQLIDAVKPHYDYVIVDAPPLGLVVDAAVISKVCDGAVLVINQGKVKYRAAQEIVGQLQSTNCRILGAVLNQVSDKKSGKSDSYYYQYKNEG